MLPAEDLRQSEDLKKYLFWKKESFFLSVWFFLSQTERLSLSCKQQTVNQMSWWRSGRRVHAGSGGGSGLWLESSSNSPSVSNVSFSHQQESRPRIAPIGWRAMEGKKVKERENKGERWMPILAFNRIYRQKSQYINIMKDFTNHFWSLDINLSNFICRTCKKLNCFQLFHNKIYIYYMV